MKDINNVKIIGDHIIELDVDKAMVVTDDEIPCASYPVVCSDEALIKQVISQIGYKTTFIASNGNDIDMNEIKEITLFCNFYTNSQTPSFPQFFPHLHLPFLRCHNQLKFQLLRLHRKSKFHTHTNEVLSCRTVLITALM